MWLLEHKPGEQVKINYLGDKAPSHYVEPLELSAAEEAWLDETEKALHELMKNMPNFHLVKNSLDRTLRIVQGLQNDEQRRLWV